MTASANPEPLIRICDGTELLDGGAGVRFPVQPLHARPTRRITGFVVRFEGVVYGYVNQCAHVPTELDWDQGQFFDRSGLYLMCATHGAVYEPESGRCTGGPCRGASLRAIDVVEIDGVVSWRPDETLRPPPENSGIP